MRRLLYLLPCLLCLFTCGREQKRNPPPVEEHGTVPQDWFYLQRAFPYGAIDRDAYRRARAEMARHSQRNGSLRHTTTWELVGPVNIGGRITDLEMWPDDEQTILAGTASGGIFRSTDQGRNWTPVFDDMPTLAIGDLAISPSQPEVVYAGTGEANAGGGSIAYDGAGVYRSEDRGLSWQSIGLEHAGSIGRMAVHPQRANTVFVAAMGHLFENNPERGLFRTTDGGDTWEKVLYLNDSTGVIDVVLHPDDPSILYAATWERVRRPQRRAYSGPSSGIWRSTDGGDSWSRLSLPPNGHNDNLGRIGLAVSPVTPDHVIAYVIHPFGQVLGIYQSTDRGDSWATLPKSGIDEVSFMWWFGKIWMHPTKADHYYLAGLNMHELKPGAEEWTPVFPGAHVDQHALVVHPQRPELVIAGNDGGIYISEDGGQSHRHVDNMPITQFYTAHIDRSAADRLLGGTQDNGVIRTYGQQQSGWDILFFADGFRTMVDPRDSNVIFLSFQYGNLMRSTSGGRSFFSATSGIPGTDRTNWHTPIIMDPDNPRTLYYGSQKVYQTTNRGYSWDPISPDLTDGDPGGNLTYGTLTDLSLSMLKKDLLYAGTDDGRVWRTDDGGRNWIDISRGLPKRWVTTVLASPIDTNEVFVTVSGFRFGEDMAHIYRSTDRGSTWTPIDGGLPDVPVNDLVLTRFRTLYAATDVGIFRSEDLGQSWAPFQNGLPATVVNDLDYDPATDLMLAATFGRSMFQTRITDVLTGLDEVAFAKKGSISPNPATDQVNVRWTSITGRSGQLILMDTKGRTLQSTTVSAVKPEEEQTYTLYLGHLAAGTYWLRWQTDQGVVWTEQVIIAN